MKILIDQIGNEHKFDSIPARIVSLVPSQTELLCDLGLENNLIGITKFCVHPNHLLKSKTIIGGTKTVNYEKIRLLNPDIIIANKEENSLEIVTELSKICTVWVTNILSLVDNVRMISDFGLLFNKQIEAQKWIENIETARIDFELFIDQKTFKNVAYFIWANPYMVAAKGTFINELLGINKLKNVYQNLNRYPEISIEEIEQYAPEMLFLSSEPFPFKEKHKNEIQKFTDAKIILVDGEYFSWHGSRILKAFAYFHKLQQNLD